MTAKQLKGIQAPDGSEYVTLTDGEGNLAGLSATIGTIEVSAQGNQATATDKSGTITSGGSAQTLAALNAARTGFLIQNQSTGDLWISAITTAVASQPSLWLPAGSYYEFPATGVPTYAISIIGATTGQAFAAREW